MNTEFFRWLVATELITGMGVILHFVSQILRLMRTWRPEHDIVQVEVEMQREELRHIKVLNKISERDARARSNRPSRLALPTHQANQPAKISKHDDTSNRQITKS